MNTQPRIAGQTLAIAKDQTLSTLTGWEWGPTWSLPGGRSGWWVIHDQCGVAVMCELKAEASPIGGIQFARELDQVRDHEQIEARRAYLARVEAEEASLLGNRAAVKAEHETVRVPKRRTVLARTVEKQLADILETA